LSTIFDITAEDGVKEWRRHLFMVGCGWSRDWVWVMFCI